VSGPIDFTASEYSCDTGPVTIEASGPHMEIKFDLSTEIVGGHTTEIFGRTKLEVTVGDLLELVIAVQNSITLGWHNDLDVAGGLDFAPFRQELHLYENATHGLYNAEEGTHLAEQGTEVKTGGPLTALRALCTFL